jgi:hypothetical protein
MIDGGLRPTFHKNLPDAQWTSIENSISSGMPDSEYCFPGGASGWIEFKRAYGAKIKFRPLQPGWIYRRARLGGRVFVAVLAGEELVIYRGLYVRELARGGLRCGVAPALASWDWGLVRALLTA